MNPLHLNDLKSDGYGPLMVAGSFAPNGSSAVSAASNKGIGWSVARTGAGTFRVTFSDDVPLAISAKVHLQHVPGHRCLGQVGCCSYGCHR
jgi:hypothetical protein